MSESSSELLVSHDGAVQTITLNRPAVLNALDLAMHERLAAALEIEVGRVLYLSENIYVESGDYRHELILYRLAAVRGGPHGTPSDPRLHEWHRPGEQPGPLLPEAMAAELAFDLADGFRRPIQHLVTVAAPPG